MSNPQTSGGRFREGGGITTADAGLTDQDRAHYIIDQNPVSDVVGLDYKPRGDAGVDVDEAEEVAVKVITNADPARRSTLIEPKQVVDSASYGVTVDGASNSASTDSTATEAEVIDLVTKVAQNITSKPVWANTFDADLDGVDDSVLVEEFWSKFSLATVAADTTYSVGVEYRDGLSTTTTTVSHTSASSGADSETIVTGIRDAFDNADLPIEAQKGGGGGESNDDLFVVAPSKETMVTFTADQNVVAEASHTQSPRADLGVSDNSGGDYLRVLQEATAMTFTIWGRHRDSGIWSKIRGAQSLQRQGNWTEVLGSVSNYDRMAIHFESLSGGRVGATIAPATG